MESFEVRLARIEERLQHITLQLDRLLEDSGGVQYMRQTLGNHANDIAKLREGMSHARGIAVVVSAVVGMLAAILPEYFWRK